MIKGYPVTIFYIPPKTSEGELVGYYIAWLPDFGWSACSATGDSVDEALEILQHVAADVIDYYKETGREIPMPTVPA